MIKAIKVPEFNPHNAPGPGLPAGAGTELQALAGHTQTAAEHRQGLLDRLKRQNGS